MIENEYLEVIKCMPDIYLYQFFKISCYYLGLVEGAKNNLNTSSDKIVYINEVSKAQMMLNKLLMISTNSIGVESQINNDSEKTNKAISEAYEFLKKRYLSLPTTDTVENENNSESDDKFITEDTTGKTVELGFLGLTIPTVDEYGKPLDGIEKPKRGRKPKKKIDKTDIDTDSDATEVKTVKKGTTKHRTTKKKAASKE